MGRANPYDKAFEHGQRMAMEYHKMGGATESLLPAIVNDKELGDGPPEYTKGFYMGVYEYYRTVVHPPSTTQSKLESFIEACVSTVVGLVVTMSAYPLINLLCDVKMSTSQVAMSTVLFTILSVARGYVIRRFFNNLNGVKKFFIKLFSKRK